MAPTRRQKQLEELDKARNEDGPGIGSEDQAEEVGLPRGLLLTEPVDISPLPEEKVSDRAKESKEAKKENEPKRRGTAQERSLQQLAEEIETQLDTVFGLISTMMPVTGVYAVKNSEKAVKAFIEIAKNRPAVLKALSKVADGANAVTIGQYILGIMVCIQVDSGRIKPDSVPAQVLGVTAVVDEFFAEEKPSDINPNVVVMDVPHGRFSPVR